jgi:hypothetical protein
MNWGFLPMITIGLPMKDKRFPWIDFPDNPKIGQRWTIASKVLPGWATWEYRTDGWHEVAFG